MWGVFIRNLDILPDARMRKEQQLHREQGLFPMHNHKRRAQSLLVSDLTVFLLLGDLDDIVRFCTNYDIWCSFWLARFETMFATWKWHKNRFLVFFFRDGWLGFPFYSVLEGQCPNCSVLWVDAQYFEWVHDFEWEIWLKVVFYPKCGDCTWILKLCLELELEFQLVFGIELDTWIHGIELEIGVWK